MAASTRYVTIPIDTSKSREERVMDGMMAWAAFWRANPHRFVKDYLNVNLKKFQQINLLMMDRCNYSVYIASRGRLASPHRNMLALIRQNR